MNTSIEARSIMFRVWMVSISILTYVCVDWPPIVAAATPRRFGGGLTVSAECTVRSLDPVQLSTMTQWQIADLVHATVFRFGADGNIEPALAYSLPEVQSNGREWLIRLRSDAWFHNGIRVTVDDVIASWQRLLDRHTGSPHWWLMSAIEGSESYRNGLEKTISGLIPVNRLTLRVRLSRPMPEFLECLSALPTAILPVRQSANHTSAIARPFGAGPFFLSELNQSLDEIEVRAFLKYPKGRPYLDKVTFRPFSSELESSLEWNPDNIHICWDCMFLQKGKLQPSIRYTPQIALVFLSVNPDTLRSLPKSFMSLMNDLLDQDFLSGFLSANRAQTLYPGRILSPSQQTVMRKPGYNSGLRSVLETHKTFQLDTSQAPLVLLIRKCDSLEGRIAQRIQLRMKDLGLDVTVVEEDFFTYQRRKREKNYDITLEHPLPFTRSPMLMVLGLLAAMRPDLSEVRIPDKIAAGLTGVDAPVLLERWIRARMKENGWIPLIRYARHIAIHPNVHECRVDQSGLIDLANLWTTD